MSGAAALAAIAVACFEGRPRLPRPAPGSLVFAIEPVAARQPTRVAWSARYETAGTTSRFRVEIEPEPKGTQLPTFVRCALVREPGADGAPLLRSLGRALGARRVPEVRVGVEALEISAALLGRNLSRGSGRDQIAGAFTSEPPGTWIATKLFLADGAGEVFLNLDPVAGYGELSTKDPSYADVVVAELGRLLMGDVLPEAATAAPPPEPSASLLPAAAPTPDPNAGYVQQQMEKAVPGVLQFERRAALERLAKAGPRAKAAVPVFLTALQDPDPLIRGEALRGLPKLRPDAELGAAAVTPLLKDPIDTNQVWAAEALVDFGQTDKAVTYLTVFLRGRASTWAAAALTKIGPRARSAVPSLIEMLEKRSSSEQGYAACRALAAIGSDAAAAVPALQAAANDSDTYVRDAARYALREIGTR